MRHRLTRYLAFTLAASSASAALLAAFPAAAAEQIMNLTPSADTYIVSGVAGENYGKETRLRLFMNFSNNSRILVRFDLSSLPRNAIIESAVLSFGLVEATGTSSVAPIVYRLTASWNENAVTWDTLPASAEEVTSNIITNYPERKTFDLTDAARHWADGTWQNHGVVIVGREGVASNLNYERRFSSVEGSEAPLLTITYSLPTDSSPPVISNISAETATGGQVIITWRTTEPATARVEYGPTAAYGNAKDDIGYALEQRMTLENLSNGAYHYRVISADTVGNSAASSDFSFTLGTAPTAPTVDVTPPPPAPVGRLIKLRCLADAEPNDPCRAVYYVDRGGKRHAFPNEKIYFSWYADYSRVETVTPDELAAHALGKNVRYKPGARLVKFRTLPKTYSIGIGGALQWLTTEALAAELYGAAWNTMVDDLSDAFAGDYKGGADIKARGDLATGATPTLSLDDDLQS